MRPDIVSEAGVPTRIHQWWEAIPFLTSAVLVVCGVIYLVCLLVGYDSFSEVCFLPAAVISRFQVYRAYTSILFHGSLLHVAFNMLALVPMGSELERIMGSIRLLYLIVLLAASNAILHLLLAAVVAYNPFHPYEYLMNECAIGFSGILFSMIVIETSLSGVQSRSVFGLFNVPAKLYAWILLIAFQILMTNVSLLGHLCGILSGFAYSYGVFNFLMPGSSFFSSIESSSWLSTFVRRPKYIMCMGGTPSGYIPSYVSPNTSSSGPTRNVWRNLASWMPQREESTETIQDTRFPGRGRILNSGQDQARSYANTNLQTRLLDDSSGVDLTDRLARTGDMAADGRPGSEGHTVAATPGNPTQVQGFPSEEQIQKLVAMGFERTQVEVALAAADGDLNVAAEILMSQQG